MKTQLICTLGAIATACLMTTAACTPPASEAPATAPEESAPVPEQPIESVPLIYNGPEIGIPVIAQYPDTMTVMESGSSEGVGVFFRFDAQGTALDEAEVNVFLPANTPSTTELMTQITGDNGLIANNGWTLAGSRADTAAEFPYPWFEMVFDISASAGQTGHILIGQSDGQAIQVILLYPPEMADAYWNAANLVLDSLQFDASLLPVTTTEGSLE